MKKSALSTLSVLSAMSLWASSVEVTDETKILMSDANTALVAAPVNETAYPADLGVTPSFWLDASDTTGWTIGEGGEVSRIPSKVSGSARYLKVAEEEGDVWPIYQWKPKAPVLVEGVAACGGKSVLDFGAVDSYKGLVFNVHSENGGAPSNSLERIGTVCAVYDSSASGGFFLGGGYLPHSDSNRNGYWWARGVDTVKSGAAGQYYYSNPILQYFEGTIRQDGFPTVGTKTGMAGDWQVLTYVCTTAVKYPATGIGINEGRNLGGRRGGGMRIAEMIFFEDILTSEQCRRVEAYLQGKWFGRTLRGQNGRAGVANVVIDANNPSAEVGAGETLTIDSVKGGHGTAPESSSDRFTKTGEGTLELGDASRYARPIVLQAGALSFAAREVPTAANYPDRLYIHLDATGLELGSLSVWDNLCTQKFMDREFDFTAPAGFEPTVAVDAQLGAPCVDFGAAGPSGCYMTPSSDSTAVTLKGLATVIAVARGVGGGDFLSTDGHVYIDGVRQPEGTSAFLLPGWRVVAYRASGANFQYLGKKDSVQGGVRIAEFLAWDRVLREDEIKDVSAYLAQKWLGRTLVGYRTGTAVEGMDVQSVKAAGSTSIDVSDDTVKRFGSLELEGMVTKTGGGILEVASDVAGAENRLLVKGGAVVRGASFDPETKTTMAVAPAMHLDATATDTMDIVEVSGEKRIQSWMDVSGANAAQMETSAYQPYLDTENTLNGNSVVEFGALGTANGGRYMSFVKSVESVRAAYVVWNTENGGGCLLGNLKTSDIGENVADFRRGASPSGGTIGDATCPFLYNSAPICTLYTNGVAVANAGTDVPSSGWLLVEVYPDDSYGLRASGLANHYAGLAARAGGQRLGEVILYDRALTEREKVATRNYLLKKWFGKTDAELADLPGSAPVETPVVARAFDAEGGATYVVPSGLTSSAKRLIGEGAVAKSGDGTVSVDDLSCFTGTVSVAAGTLAVKGKSIPFDTELVTDGCILHLDATQGLTLDGANVTEWTSVSGDGWTAVPGTVTGQSTWYPTVRPDDLKGKATVDMTASDKIRAQFFRFKKDGEYARLTDIRTVFWVLGSQNGGGYLFGGGNSGFGAFFRGDFTSSSPLIGASQSDASVRTANWQVNGEAVANPTADAGVLSGGWDIVSMALQPDSASTAADGLAYDPRVLADSPTMQVRSGAQRLGEVIVYDRVLSSEEILKVTNYLRAKWDEGYQSSALNAAKVELAADATLDCGGSTQYVAAFSGTGAVANGGLAAGEVVCDAAATDWPSVDGTFGIVPGLKVRLENLGTVETAAEYKILSATAFEGVENLPSAAAVDLPPSVKRIRLFVRDGALWAKVYPPSGMILIFR